MVDIFCFVKEYFKVDNFILDNFSFILESEYEFSDC